MIICAQFYVQSFRLSYDPSEAQELWEHLFHISIIKFTVVRAH
jgi:hypothetical protein